MKETRIQINSIIENQLPGFVQEQFPLVLEFLKEYYKSQEISGSSYDILQNIDEYIKIDNNSNLIEETTLKEEVSFFDTIIKVNSTKGFPDRYGLIKIDEEIITYKSKTENSFEECVRGFSGVENLKSDNNPEKLLFTSTLSSDHKILDDRGNNTKVINLSILFLKEFLRKIKKQIVPGFENRELYSNENLNEEVDEKLFIKQSKDFYRSKGTDKSFNILFKSLYGSEVKVIKPRDFLIQPSDAQYRITKDLVVESIQGNPLELVNRTLFQDTFKGSSELTQAYGSVTSVQKIIRSGKEYYIISLDYDFDKDINVTGSIYGQFTITPKTKTTSKVSLNDTSIYVDSTVGFPSSGKLILKLNTGNSIEVSYSSKTLNQFLQCVGITQEIDINEDVEIDNYAYSFIDRNQNEKILVRITGVLSDLEYLTDTYQLEKGDTAKIISLGTIDDDVRLNNWIFNSPISYEIEKFTKINSSSYEIYTYDSNIIFNNDIVELDYKIGGIRIKNQFTVQSGSDPNKSFIIRNDKEIENIYEVKKILTKTVGYDYSANIQNTYKDYNGSVYVTSSSLPKYSDQDLDIKYGLVSLNYKNPNPGITTDFIGISQIKHPFLTGDAVAFIPKNPNDSNKGIYFVKNEEKIVQNNRIYGLKLSSSRENIFQDYLSDKKNKFLSFDDNIEGEIVLLDFVDENLNLKKLETQKIIRQIDIPKNSGKKYQTNPGFIGIFSNGVEIFNYKSKDSVYYGPIEDVKVSSGGTNYDVSNPPILKIADLNGSNFSGICEVEGSLQKINILDPGFDYIDEPNITITGANGKGAKVKANLVSVDHLVSFNSEEISKLVNLQDNSITLSTDHKFRDNEKVFYITNNQQEIGGLIDNSVYYVSVKSEKTVKLHRSLSDSILGINTVSITSYGRGIQYLKSFNKKKIIGSVSIIDKGFGYRSRKIDVNVDNVNLYNDTIYARSHGYQNGDVVEYNTTGTSIGGLSIGKYIVTKVNDDLFKLSEFNDVDEKLFFRNKQYIKFTSKGTGIHSFNYPPISLKISGPIGISSISTSNKDYTAKLEPIFRGQVKSIFITNNGYGYGSQEVLNLHRKPSYELISGKDAKAKPIISNGKITQVLILNQGKEYNCPPDVFVTSIDGSGSGAILTPIIENGKLKEVRVINGGFNYNKDKTTITINSAGRECKLDFRIKSWNINLYERLRQTNQISLDGGIIADGLSRNYGLQYSHLYCPLKLREILYSIKEEDGDIFYRTDSQNDFSENKYHSPIIGWAYDGNPIYGPYGFINPEGGFVGKIKSGYSDPKLNNYRPSIDLYPLGFFIEDYEYVGGDSAHLDEFNGRFCKTPEFPNGTYAYFATLDDNNNPKFPYLIGKYYKSQPIEFNFDPHSNQDEVDIQKTNWLRNTSYYNFNSKNTNYDFIINPNENIPQLTDVVYSTTGSIDEIKVSKGGYEYKVGDTLVFDNNNTGGYNAFASVSSIEGRETQKIEYINYNIGPIELESTNNFGEYVAYTETPHNIKNNEIVNISGVNSEIDNYYKVKVDIKTLILSENIPDSSITGKVTYFNVYGNLELDIKENDIYQIGFEKVKILNVDKKSSRIRVLRDVNGPAYSSGEKINELPRKFKFNSNKETAIEHSSTRELYFDPQESVGIGTTFGSFISISNPGIGVSQIFVPFQSIYIPNHKLNTGDIIRYYSNNNPVISINDGQTTFNLNSNDNLYVAKISDDLFGISRNRIGIGSTGSFVGIGTSKGLLYFISIGSGKDHSFKTVSGVENFSNASKSVVNVTTKEDHNLSVGDEVTIECNPTDNVVVVVKYNLENRRILINPSNFTSNSINLTNSTIFLEDHSYKTGDKVIYTSNDPSIGLVSNKIYYVIVVNNNLIRLSDSYYNSNLGIYVKILSTSSGTISKINPEITLYKNNKVIFDLSDSSLSINDGSNILPAFYFGIYNDPEFLNEFVATTKNNTFEIKKFGTIGTNGAKVEFNINDNVPSDLYYTLVPINQNLIFNDSEFIINSNKIKIKNSIFNRKNIIDKVTDKTFSYTINVIPEKNSYDSGIKYTTTSKTASGPIDKIKIKSGGKGYKKLPYIEKISSENGYGSVLVPITNTIGRIKSTKILDIGFEYSSDYSLRPTAKFPDILKVEPLSAFEKIDIISHGKNYNTPPQLIVLDGITGKLVDDVILKYDIGDKEVKIVKNSTGFYNAEPVIIPINNPNGVGISLIFFDSITNDVTITLNKEYSDFEDYPFKEGDKILVENVSVLNGRGYNSSEYNYSLFTITKIDRNIGGSQSTITYNISEFLNEFGSDTPGIYDPIESYGRVIPSRDFPIFRSTLKRNEFFKDEYVFTENSDGYVESWDSENQYLKVQTNNTFKVNSIVKGKISRSQAIITSVISFPSVYKVSPTSIVKKGWNKETGFLNNSLQRIHDSDYYQYFSYSLKSPISFETWDDAVDNLNHTSGFKKFSDLDIISYDKEYSGISTHQGDFSAVSHLTSIIDLDCYNDFDLVTENNLNIDNKIISSEITFNSREIQDYSESIGNRVLKIDNISNQFNHIPRSTPYTIVDTFRLDSGHSRKYFTYVKDKRYTDERQLMIVSLLHDNDYFYINQYGRIDTYGDLGSFDVTIIGEEASLLFYPHKFEFNNYDISFVNYTLNSNVGFGSTAIGNFVNIVTDQYSFNSDVNQTIISLPTNVKSIKALVQILNSDGDMEFDEFTILNYGTDVDLLEYGQLTNSNLLPISSSGLGTYYSRISGSNILVDFIPSISGVGMTITTLITSINSNGQDGDEIEILNSKIKSTYTNILPLENPIENIISFYDNNEYDSAYCIVVLEDKTNNKIVTEEIIIINDLENQNICEYAILNSGDTFGTFSVNSSVDNKTKLNFIPDSDIEVEVRVLQKCFKIPEIGSTTKTTIQI